MKILLTTLNAKYVHTNLALQYLKAMVKDHQVFLKEFTINEPEEQILSSIYEIEPDILACSCYIWNIEKILRLSKTLKKVIPSLKVILGGPEVSYEVEDLMNKNPWLDYVIAGEGEKSFQSLLRKIESQDDVLDEIGGLVWRELGRLRINPTSSFQGDWINNPSPFQSSLDSYYVGKNIYYESSRGCPFSCSYCLSGHGGKGVSYLPLERVKRELNIISKSGAKQIKFVDRTFNCHPERALEIWQYILNLGKGANYHFEISADLLNDSLIDFLSQVPEGLFNFEIGIQTTQPKTLEAIYRKSSLDKAFTMIKNLLEKTKITVYLDLIVGLPYEDWQSFQFSFNQVMALRPHRLQVGFLKLLKGSRIKKEAEQYSYKYLDYPPYQVLENKFISFGEIDSLKKLEQMVDKYYNSQKFSYTLNILVESDSYFDFFQSLAEFWAYQGLFNRSVGLDESFSVLAEFIREQKTTQIEEILRFDYLLLGKPGSLPKWFRKVYSKDDREKHAQLVNDERIIETYLPHLKYMTRKDRINSTHSDYLDLSGLGKKSLVLFDYSCGQKTSYYFLQSYPH